MPVYKDDNTGKWLFRVYVTHPVTKERVQKQRRGFELRRDALEAEARFLSDYKTKSIIHSNVQMNNAIDGYYEYSKKRIKITTFSGYRYQIEKHIRPYFGKIEIRKVNRLLIDNWYNNINEMSFAASYKNKLLSRLLDLFKFIELEYDHRIGYIHNLPPYQKTTEEQKRKITIYNEKDFIKLINHAKNDLEVVLFKTLFLSGLRIAELRGLKWIDIDLEKKTIDVRRQLTSKVKGHPSLTITPKSESSNRTVHIPNELLNELKSWKSIRSKRKKYKDNWQVFGDCGTIHENTIRRYLKNASKRANLPHITPHQLRHSYVTYLYGKGVAPEVIKEQLGHSSIQVTLDIYNHITSLQKQTAIDDAYKD